MTDTIPQRSEPHLHRRDVHRLKSARKKLKMWKTTSLAMKTAGWMRRLSILWMRKPATGIWSTVLLLPIQKTVHTAPTTGVHMIRTGSILPIITTPTMVCRTGNTGFPSTSAGTGHGDTLDTAPISPITVITTADFMIMDIIVTRFTIHFTMADTGAAGTDTAIITVRS